MQSVSSLTTQIKSLLEATFLHVKVSGEVSRPTYHSSGHLYFTLKDDQSSISCVMFKGNNQRLKFRVEDGMAVDISGSISVYAPRGSYQINCVSLSPSGSGALALAYEQLKKELYKKGYFEQKRPLPKIPRHVALITSKTGAALQDMLNVAKKRYPLVKLTLFNTLVQGEDAKYHIVNALQKAQTIDPDIIVLSRGGGSVEDLWAFNEREVAEAVFTCKIPTVSAIGHAIDTVITDFVADKSAPTPSAAMEMILPDINEFKILLDNLNDNLKNAMNYKIQNANSHLSSLQNQISLFSPKAKIDFAKDEIINLKKLFDLTLEQKFKLFSSNIDALNLAYKSKNPQNFLKNGYAQIVQNGKITDLKLLKKDDTFELHDSKKTVSAKVLHVK